ncbi:MAG TPA: TonB family protein [Caulobacterales bacterium]|nr:TonB family protein [Caulobacterales bacterium]
MLVWATRTVSALTLRIAFFGGLFLVVAIAQVAITTALRAVGWSGGASLAVSGAAVLAIVLSGVQLAEIVAERRAAARELERLRQGLPSGPCCIVWRTGEGEAEMPWELMGAVQAEYPKLARRLGVEGFAILEFEINSEGMAKNIHCVDVWPSQVFFDAARAALTQARFRPRGDTHPRFGASYRMPFVFRIAGAARLRDRGRKAQAPRPALKAATQAVEKLRRSA